MRSPKWGELGFALVLWKQDLSNEGSQSARQKTNRCKLRRNSEAGKGRRVCQMIGNARVTTYQRKKGRLSLLSSSPTQARAYDQADGSDLDYCMRGVCRGCWRGDDAGSTSSVQRWLSWVNSTMAIALRGPMHEGVQVAELCGGCERWCDYSRHESLGLLVLWNHNLSNR